MSGESMNGNATGATPVDSGSIPDRRSKLRIVPVSLRTANAFVTRHHRHSKARRAHKFSLGVSDGERLVGVAIVGWTASQWQDSETRLEVSRLCTDGTKNACSMLYGASAKIAKIMGYKTIGTYTRQDEPGTALRASGWREVHRTNGKMMRNQHRRNPPELFQPSKELSTTPYPRIYWEREL